jgi:hypothetical protein
MTEQKVYKVLVVGCSRQFFEFFVDNNYCRRLITRINNRHIQSSGVIRFEYLGTIFRFYHGTNVTALNGNVFSKIFVANLNTIDPEVMSYLMCATTPNQRKPLVSHGSPDWQAQRKLNLERRKLTFLGELGT